MSPVRLWKLHFKVSGEPEEVGSLAWSCRRCTLENPAVAMRCGACGSSRALSLRSLSAPPAAQVAIPVRDDPFVTPPENTVRPLEAFLEEEEDDDPPCTLEVSVVTRAGARYALRRVERSSVARARLRRALT